MRERCDLRRHATLCEGPGDVRLPDPGPHQPFAEAVGLAQLEADPVHRVPENHRGSGLAEGVVDALFFRIQPRGVPGREAFRVPRCGFDVECLSSSHPELLGNQWLRFAQKL